MKKLFTCITALVGVVAFAQPAPSPDYGSVKRYENFKSELVTPRHIDVWTPNGYSDKEKYAVLYMHDGQMLFDRNITWNKQEWQADDVAAALIEQDATRKFIIVGISSDPQTRHSDYFPQKPFEMLTEKQQDSLYSLKLNNGAPLFAEKINSDNYLKFIVTELKPFIDKTYSVKTDAANTFIAGSSMGALISLYAVCEYPQVFGGAGCLSTHWPGVFSSAKNPIPDVFLKYMEQKLPPPSKHKFYFDRGTETLDAEYGPYQTKADALMKKKGYTDANFKSEVFEGLDHSEDSWAARVDRPMMFLLTK